ncbi:Lachesin [Daphnia magna]|uniref:Lachesin n=1 Tax=Daphnia magna TaxID=35525 RepID=A0A164G0U7_9CRUS|nr:Lachesin [Daphnia magna]
MITQVGIVDVVVPPVIVDAGSSASHITIREGLSLTLTCRGDGVPAPKVTWRREDGRPIYLGEKRKDGMAFSCLNSNQHHDVNGITFRSRCSNE